MELRAEVCRERHVRATSIRPSGLLLKAQTCLIDPHGCARTILGSGL